MGSSRADELPRLVTTRPAPIRFAVRPSMAIRAMLLALFIANLGRIPVFSTGEREAPVLLNDLAVGATLLIGAVAMIRARSVRLDSVALVAILFAFIGGVSAVLSVPRFGLSGFELTVSLAYLARWVFYFCLYIVVINTISARDVMPVWRALESVLIALAVFGVFQAAFLPGFAQLVYPESREYVDWDIQGHRLVSTILDPNLVGAMFLVGLLTQLAMLSCGARIAQWKPLLLFAALVLTLSRSAALGLIAGAGVILLVRGLSKRALRLAAVVGVVLLALLPKLIAFGAQYGKFSLGGSAATRLVSWLLALRVFIDHWFIGVGFNTYGYVASRYGGERLGVASYSSDGGLLFIAVMTGVAGLAAFLWMLLLVWRRCRTIWRNANCSPDQRGLAIGVAASMVGVCVSSVFVNSLLTTFIIELLWVSWGLTFVIAANAAPASEPPTAPRIAALATGATR